MAGPEEFIDIGESPLWRRRGFIYVADESAMPELRRELEGHGLVCYELDGTRISDFETFGEEAARAGIFGEDEYFGPTCSTIVPHGSAILWRHADQLFEANPTALINAVHQIRSNAWTSGRGPEQVELFLLGEGRLVESRPEDVRPQLTDEEQAHVTVTNLMFAIGFNIEVLKSDSLWTPELQSLKDAFDAATDSPAQDDLAERKTRKSLVKLIGAMETLLHEHDIQHQCAMDILEPDST